MRETCDQAKGFAKQFSKTAASIDLSKLPAGFGFAFEFKATDTTENKSTPAMVRVTVSFM
ncbi:MAG: hypothetical protein R3236_09245 [Phycisphaeraceae bacterium]|nr:hypothetical protein [Phycisphaeraceae bacterium]